MAEQEQQLQQNSEQAPVPEAAPVPAPEATASPAEATVPSAESTAPAVESPSAEGQDEERPHRGGERPERGGERPQHGGARRGSRERDRRGAEEEGGVESSVVRIYRCAKVVKGGRTFSFGALVVVGDRHGNVGIGYGKANEVPPSVEKATKDARKAMFKVNLKGGTIPHMVKGSAGASTVVLVPARPGTGVTAGKSVRPVLELAGITDILSKAYGSTSAKNLVKATIAALRKLQSKEQVEKVRGVALAAGAGELD